MDVAEQDLDLAVELVNSYWVLADPPERLVDVAHYQRILRDAGEAGLADQLHPDNLEELRALRGNLAEVFGAESTEAAVALLDRYLTDAAITAGLKTAADGVACWSFTGGRTGIAVLRTRLLTALAGQLIRHGTTRMGVCQAAPCNCVYIDRSRARTRRYCCDQCNDRASIAAYRRRQSAKRN